MPLYDYACSHCGEFAAFRPMAERGLPMKCPSCGRRCERLISAPNLGIMTAANRRKWALNEKSRYEPRIGSKHVCSGSSGCGAGMKDAYSKYQTGRAGSRPWMLGH